MTEQKSILVFRDMQLFPSLNILLREHFTKRTKRLETIMWLIKEQKCPTYPGTVKITYVRYHTHLQDWDNHCASFKIIGDALVKLGIIKDDKPTIVVKFVPEQERVKKKEDIKIAIYIEPFFN